MNSFFKENRNKAFGIGATITGLGPVFFPQLVTILLNCYGPQGCILIIGGISMNIIVAALLLQPAKWHLKPQLDNASFAEKDSLHKIQSFVCGYLPYDG